MCYNKKSAGTGPALCVIYVGYKVLSISEFVDGMD